MMLFHMPFLLEYLKYFCEVYFGQCQQALKKTRDLRLCCN